MALILILVGLFWPSIPDAPAVTGFAPVEIGDDKQDKDAVELPGQPVPGSYLKEDDESHDVTRIIVVDPDGEEITGLLSEKVIIDDEVVDQSAKPE